MDLNIQDTKIYSIYAYEFNLDVAVIAQILDDFLTSPEDKLWMETMTTEGDEWVCT